MRLLLAVGTLLPLLLGGGVSAAQAANDACTLSRVGSAALASHPDGTMSLPAKVNGHEVSLLLDTAAPVSTMSYVRMKALGMQPGRLGTVDMPDGETLAAGDTPDSAVVAGISSDHLTLYAKAPRDGFDGAFALNMLQAGDVELDPAGGKMNIFAPGHCSGNAAYWTRGPVAVVPFTLNRAGQIVISAGLNGNPIEAVLDSAAPVSHIQKSALKRSAGVTFATSVKSLTLEGLSVGAPVIDVDPSPMYDAKPYLFIGANVLRKLHILVANSEHRLYITPADAH